MTLKSPLKKLLAMVLILSGCTNLEQASEKTLNKQRLTEVRSAVTEMRSMLEDYYAGSGVLKNSWYLREDHPGRQEGIDFLAEKFARALVWHDSFVIGTIGSSVTAGHDNCRYDCYQQQLERLMTPVLAAGGVRFEVRNTGQGGDCGDSFDNQVWCLPMLVGDDVDITHYSWTYFEAGSAKLVPAVHEMFYRWSLMMKHSPVPQLLYTNNCDRFQDADKELLDHYTRFGADVLCMTRGLAKLGYKRGKWGEMGNPLHSSSREGELSDTSTLRSKSLAVMFRNWHPGPLLFQTTADVLAWRYSTALLQALDWLEAEPYPGRRWPRKTHGLSLADLPVPTQCPEPWCTTESMPSCINFEKPTFGIPGIELVDVENSGWFFEQGKPITQKAIPREERNLPHCIHPNRCSGWKAPDGKDSDWLSFKLPMQELGIVGVCCGKKRCGQELLDSKAEFLLNGKPPAGKAEVLWNSKCVLLEADLSESDPTDSLGLSIRLPASASALPPITHVFGL